MEQCKIVKDHGTRYPLGVTREGNKVHLSVAAPGKQCVLLLYPKGRKKHCSRVEFPPENRVGDVWSMTLEGLNWDQLEYCYEIDGEMKADPYGISFSGTEKWGDLEKAGKVPRAGFAVADFDWEGDTPLEMPFEDMILYRIHPRGFTKHNSSGVEHKGTFRGIEEKIPYLKELGVTAVEMMPPVEFEEVEMPKTGEVQPFARAMEPTGKINYWGYAPACYFAPKAAYGSDHGKQPAVEFKHLVKAFHQNGLELIIELYFSGKESPDFITDVLRFWVQEYHVDGIHLVGQVSGHGAALDPYLSRTKLFATSWDREPAGESRHLAEYHDGFLVELRRLLKGDEDQMNNLIYRTRRNPKKHGVINYMAHTNGFTMMDMVSYDQKHNEDNGEGNLDGTNYNYSWNCGVEGATRKKKIMELRKKQLKNAYLMLFLSQGTPLLLAGDEFGNSKKGNNNSYCQDNEISWLDWSRKKTNEDLYDFVKWVIGFRKKHRVFHMAAEPMNSDWQVCGLPDMSYHGVNAWKPEFENFRRQMGIMYCGQYGKGEDGTPDNDFYVAYNMHWEPHEFALPNPSKKKVWHLCVNTDADEHNGYFPEGEEPLLDDQKMLTVPPRSIVVLMGKDDQSQKA